MNNSILNFEKFSIVTPHHLHDINCKNLNIIYYKDDNKTGYREGRIIRVDLPNKVFISFRGEEHKKAYTIFLPNPRLVFGTNYSLKKPAEPMKKIENRFNQKNEDFLVYNHYYRTNMSNIKLVSLLSEVIKKSNAQYALRKNSSAKEIDEHSARSIFNYHLAETLKYPTYQFWKSFQEWPKPVPIVVDSRIVNLYTEHPQILEVVSQIPFKDLEYDLYKISNKTEKVIDITSFSFDEIKNFSFK